MNKNTQFKKNQSEWNMRESAISEPIRIWLESKGYSFFSEVPYPVGHSFIDVVGKKGELIICIELKASLTRHALHQANRSKMITDEVYIAVCSKPVKKSIDLCKKYGIGVISVTNEQVTVLALPSQINHIHHPYIKSINDTLVNGGFNGIAGLPNIKGTGPARNVLSLIEEARGDNPNISWQELFDKIPNHYSNYKSMRQSMRKALIKKFKI